MYVPVVAKREERTNWAKGVRAVPRRPLTLSGQWQAGFVVMHNVAFV
jgi:hypothetical protein